MTQGDAMTTQMLTLTLGEVSFWKQVYVERLRGVGHLGAVAAADKAILALRERLSADHPYR